jgi:hypothetical protein
MQFARPSFRTGTIWKKLNPLFLLLFFIFGGCIMLRSLLGLHYSGRQLQQSFFLSPYTHSLHVSARAGYLQVNISFPVKLLISF